MKVTLRFECTMVEAKYVSNQDIKTNASVSRLSRAMYNTNIYGQEKTMNSAHFS